MYANKLLIPMNMQYVSTPFSYLHLLHG